ncbi:MAG: triose-phosphate isomerase [Pseudomonadota bacterium]|nr:triose-phosphate isomerase [Pseudomonadota bacterium]
MKIVAGNWKMHGDAAMAHALVEAVADQAGRAPGVEVILCPPATLLAQVSTWLIGSAVKLGGQDCHAEAQGAFTGDISAVMLRESGCAYVIVGHSERRQYHRETNEDVRKKSARAIATGLIPIICIGETLSEREAGQAETVVERQLRDSIPDEVAEGRFLLAYEPVWAIGTGKVPTPEDICRMHGHILSVAADRTGLASPGISVLYGGSVKADNAREIMAIQGVSGVLVGGASLKAEEFCKIMASGR